MLLRLPVSGPLIQGESLFVLGISGDELLRFPYAVVVVLQRQVGLVAAGASALRLASPGLR